MRPAARFAPVHSTSTPAPVPRRTLLRFFGLGAAGLALGPRAWALAGGLGLQDPQADSPWSCVGSLDANGQLFTATLVGPRHVLTAAHVVNGAQPGLVSFRLAHGSGFVSRASAISVHPSYKGNLPFNPPADPSVHGDIALLRLEKAVPPSVTPARVFGGPLLGRTITLVSHGGSTTLMTVGENRVDHVFNDFLGQPATYLFDYDGPDLSSNRLGPAVPANGSLGTRREATLVNGDSGSAAFVQFDGQWWLGGINSFQLSIGGAGSGAYGSAGGGVVLAAQQAWLRAAMAAPDAAAPR